MLYDGDIVATIIGKGCIMNEEQLQKQIELITSDYGVEDAEEGDSGFYAYVDGGYLANTYQTELEALQAILKAVS